MALHVSISAETIGYVGSFPVTNSLLTGLVVSFLFLLFALSFSTKKKQFKTITRLQCLVELIIEAVFNLTKDIAGETNARIFFPLICTFMIFILVNNWIGLLPGVGTIGITKPEPLPVDEHELVQIDQAFAANELAQDNHQAIEDMDPVSGPITANPEIVESDAVEAESLSPDSHTDEALESHSQSGEHSEFVPLFRAATADLNTSIALALISVVVTQFYGVKFLGLSYFTKFFNFKQGPIFTFVGILELISEFAKIISFAFRLFGNIFAGEVLLSVMAYLAPVFIPIPFLGMEIFVGFIQALVFAILTLVFINMATIGHEDH